MMKCIYLFLCLFPSLLFGHFFIAEVRVGDFIPTTSKTRHTYGKNILDIEAEALLAYGPGPLLWVNINSFQKKSVHSPDKQQKLTLFPLSFGYKTFYSLAPSLQLYLGTGASYTYVKIGQKEDSFKKNFHQHVWGGVTKAGIVYHVGSYLFIDMFVDYYYTKIKLKQHHAKNVGGVRTGLGVGFGF